MRRRKTFCIQDVPTGTLAVYTIRSNKVKGIIFQDNRETYFLSNHPKLNGSYSHDNWKQYGYEYSWLLTVDGHLDEDAKRDLRIIK